MKKLNILFTIIVLNLLCACSNGQNPTTSKNEATAYMKERSAFKTVLTKKIKAPQEFSDFDSVKDKIQLVYFTSNENP